MARSTCLHCSHVFSSSKDVRRNVDKLQGDVDIVKTLSFSYGIAEKTLRCYVDSAESCYVCSKCFATLQGICRSQKRFNNLTENLKNAASLNFENIKTDLECTSLPVHHDKSVPVEIVISSIKKRPRSCLTPMKSGCTPKGKKLVTPSTPKANRRRLNFSNSPRKTPNTTKKKISASPGPRVKVQLGFKGSTRNTVLKGHSKLACRALVLKQYKTALNHLLQIEELKKDLNQVIKKKISQEIQQICKYKDCVLRTKNIKQFSWKTACKQLESVCPLTMDFLHTVAGPSKLKQLPRVVSSVAILLFNRNMHMGALQVINSILMFRGHVRTKVYTSFNRAGLSSSYKSAVRHVDVICEDFDLPVKMWSQKLATAAKDKDKDMTLLDDHNYALSTFLEDDSTVHVSMESSLSSVQTPVLVKPVHAEPGLHQGSRFNEANIMSECSLNEGSPWPMYIAEPCPMTTPSSINEGSPWPMYIAEPCPMTTPSSINEGSPWPMFIAEPCPMTTPSYKESVKEAVNMVKSTPIPADTSQQEEPITELTAADSPFTTVNSKDINSTTEPSFQIIMDNLNMNTKARHKTMDTSNKVFNLVHSVAVKDRAPSEDLDSVHPQADILSVPNEAFVPNAEDYKALYKDCNILIQRALVDHISALKDCKEFVTYHIPHQYTEESKKKSVIVPLGIMEKDENKTEEMIEVIEHLQQYVPRDGQRKMMPLLLGGDALSVERGDAAQKARADGVNQEDRLEGFIWKSEDWHGHVITLQEIYNLHFKGTSSAEKGTLFQLRNKFDHRGVKSVVKDAVNDCRDFVRFVTKGYIILAALQILNLTSVDDINKITDTMKKEEKKKFLEKLSSDIVEKYIVAKPFVLEQNGQDTADNNRVPCGYPGCPKTFAINGKCKEKHMNICLYKDLQHLQLPETNKKQKETKKVDSNKAETEDHKLNYSCSLLRDGLYDWIREDASKENDGDRLVRMWRLDILKYTQNNHTKYRLLSFRLQAQLLALLPPKLAHQLRHNRGVNIHGGAGKNVPGDLALEFLNMRAKDSLNSLSGNLSSSSIQRCGRSLQGCNDLIDSYTEGLQQFFGRPSNSKPSIQKDINSLVEELAKENLFDKIPGRCHHSFQNIINDETSKVNGQKLSQWLTSKKETFAKYQRSRSYQMC
ncbi:uncharacterized protein LOC143044781 [Mytilus galloprovincialis]|uniref:uncharacterized protein LOC143044781 n=1 Tax=Mytilus galloprovincialis TaxID=29158 RepID=UPI003F7C7007